VNEDSTWLHIKDGPWSWLYVTKSTDLRNNSVLSKIMRESKIEPTFVNRKSMYDLLIHFGCEESADVFKKKSV
jgi:hypothetical protein